VFNEGHVTCIENHLCFKILVGKGGGKRQLGRPKHRWAYNIKIDFEEVLY